MADVCAICNRKMGIMTGKVRFLDGSICTKCYTNAGYSTWNAGEMASMGTVSIAKWKRMNDPKASAEPEEFRIKCNTCGQLFCYTEDDVAMNNAYLRSARNSAKMGVANALFGSTMASYANSAQANRDLEKVRDFSRCPKCNSTDIRRLSEAEYEKEKTSTANSTGVNVSPADELKKFKQLLDEGIITSEEFDAKKKQLLGL